MNKAQYAIVKTITSLPLVDTKKFAKMIKVDHLEVLKVQATATYEQYRDDDTPLEDIIANSVFGGGKK